MARKRRKTGAAGAFWAIGVLAVLAVGSWWLFLLEEPLQHRRPALALSAQATPSSSTGSNDPSSQPPSPIPPGAESKPSEPTAPAKPATQPQPIAAGRVDALVVAGNEAKTRGDLIDARAKLSEAMSASPIETVAAKLRVDLSEIGQETILSPRMFENDPHVERYVIQPGDTLAKIAVANKVTAELLADINRITDKNLVRAGQTIKVIKGPFDAVVDKKTYTLDLYLGGTFVRSFRVGLGADDSTPVGKWRVSSKLMNPTYYPPRGGKVLAADDPQNPLGERWVGLTGIEGAAVGQERYGIHGTIEPDSIGKSTSMGCIRLQNADVEQLYMYLVDKHSTVTVR